MGKIPVVNNVTLDGVMQSPALQDEDTHDGFTHGGWTIPYQDAVLAKKMGELMMREDGGSLLLGRRTYAHFFSVWPKQKNNTYTKRLNKVRKYVASKTMREALPWQNSVLLEGDAADAVATLKERDDASLCILGSGELVHALARRNLIDEYVLPIFPVVLGMGRKLFPRESSWGFGCRIASLRQKAS
jgi:dihydrofolate reductase